MPRRGPGPTLYDLIKTRPEKRAERANADPPRRPVEHVETRDEPMLDESDSGRLGALFTPGRPITVPAGYILVAAALVVGLLIGAYMIGYRNAENVMQAQFDESWLEAARTNEQLADMTDPLGGGTSRSVARPAASPTMTDNATNRSTVAPPPTDSLGPIDQPPLRAGTYHFVLATTRIDGAIRLAEFCRDQQLDAYVVTSKMSNRQKVIVFPALRSGSNSSAEAVALKQKIERVGRKWKSERGGASNFSDAYIEPVSRLQ